MPRSTQLAPNKLCYLCLRATEITLAAVLARSAFAHIANPYAFLDSVAGYQVFGGLANMWIASVVPALQLTLAVCLAFHCYTLPALVVSAAMFAVFALAQASVMFRKLEVSCGCFGLNETTHVGPGTMAFTMVCLTVVLISIWAKHRQRG